MEQRKLFPDYSPPNISRTSYQYSSVTLTVGGVSWKRKVYRNFQRDNWCNLETICTAPHHGLAINRVTAVGVSRKQKIYRTFQTICVVPHHDL